MRSNPQKRSQFRGISKKDISVIAILKNGVNILFGINGKDLLIIHKNGSIPHFVSTNPKLDLLQAAALTRPGLTKDELAKHVPPPTKKEPAKKRGPAPSDVPLSIKLMLGALYDISACSYSLPQGSFQSFIDVGKDGSITFTFKVNDHRMNQEQRLLCEKQLKIFISDLKSDDFNNVLEIDTNYLELKASSKMGLFKIIDSVLEKLPWARTLEDIHPLTKGFDRNKEMRTQQIRDNFFEMASKSKKHMSENAWGKDEVLFVVESRPYRSRTHYEFAGTMALNATVRIPMGHILKTICQEEKIQEPTLRPGTERLNYGGYN